LAIWRFRDLVTSGIDPISWTPILVSFGTSRGFKLARGRRSSPRSPERLCQEADELTAIFSASYKTARANLKKLGREKKANVKSPNH
jgi:hypothetical protein